MLFDCAILFSTDTQFCNTTGGYRNIPGDSSSGLCIKVHQESKSLAQAANICKAENARLISLDTEEKYENLRSYLKAVFHGKCHVSVHN